MTASEEVTKVSELIVIGFKDQYRASEVLNELRRREWDWVADLDQAVVVRRDGEGRLRVQFSVDPTTKEGAVWGRLWGSFLSLALFVPITDGITGAAGDVSAASGAQTGAQPGPQGIVPDVKWWKETLSISDEFVRDVGAMIQPGDSALFMLLRTSRPGIVLLQLRNYGGTPLHIPLSPEQDNKLRAVLALK